MFTRIALSALALALAFALVACAADEPAPPTDDPAAGLRLAEGLYDLEGGMVQAIGTLAYVDIEGGFWAVVGGDDATIAVIQNADEFTDAIPALDGRTVSVVGERFDGASIRMAGPEIIAQSIEELSDTPGIAE